MTPAANNADVALIRTLPRPTFEQTERFARYVTWAHSWYKHLPLTPRVPFLFYLNPGAGMNLVRTSTGEVALLPITDQSTRFHYTWQTTDDYRRRFGYWDYHAARGTSFLFASDGGVVDTRGAGLRVLSPDGDWVEVPTELLRLGQAGLSALVHPSPNLHIWERDPPQFGLSEGGDVPGQLARLLGSEAADRPEADFFRLRSRLPEGTADALVRPAVSAFRAEPYLAFARHDWDWPDAGWVEAARAEGLSTEEVSALLRLIDYERLRPGLDAIFRGPPPGGDLFAAERPRQIGDIVAALNRFAGAVHRGSP